MQERVRGTKYDAFVDEVLTALTQRYGDALLVHWEDLAAQNSYRLLSKARAKVSWNFLLRSGNMHSGLGICS